MNVSAGGMDGGMDHESRGVEKTDRTGLVLDVTCVVDEKKVFRLDEREVLSLDVVSVFSIPCVLFESREGFCSRMGSPRSSRS